MITYAKNLSCELGHSFVVCDGTKYVLKENPLTAKDEWFWIYLGIYVFLVLLAGLMSGLTMGLLSLDLTKIKILKVSGTTKEQRQASKIYPLVSRHHLLLCTLLLANAAAVESMPIFLDKISDPITAIAVSVTAVLLFGEIIPQALCTRFGLSIGSVLSPLVYFLMALLFVVAWPIAKLLDCLLGHDHGTLYRRSELKALVDLQGQTVDELSNDVPDSQLSTDEILIIKGALDMKSKMARDAMVPVEHVFMLSAESRLDEDTMNEIIRRTHSRIPVYEGSMTSIIGLLLVKMLIKLDPKVATPVRDLIDTPCFRRIPSIQDKTPLYDILNFCQMGRSHLCLVYEEHSEAKKTVGIITLEDVIEELIQEEIVDETDAFVDVSKRITVARAKLSRFLSRSDSSDVLEGQKRYPRLETSDASETENASGQIIYDDQSDKKPLL